MSSQKPYTLHLGDCIEVMRTLDENSVDAIVCDPPYGLEFMGKEWDGADGFRRSLNKADVGRDNAFGRASRTSPEYRAGHLFQEWCEVWAREALRVLKPGGHLLAFSGTRTQHRMVCAIEDAGFEIRDSIPWLYASGFPKSQNVSKAIDKQAGAEREVIGTAADFARDGAARKTDGSHAEPHSEQGGHGYGDRWSAPVTAAATPEAQQWEGWGTALKPAHEPCCMARKPLAKGLTVAANVLQFGTGAINIDGCRVAGEPVPVFDTKGGRKFEQSFTQADRRTQQVGTSDVGRWPANIIHDGSEEVAALFPITESGSRKAGTYTTAAGGGIYGEFGEGEMPAIAGSAGSAARFFYCAKASRADRNDGLASSSTPAVATDATMRHCETADWSTRNGNHHPTVKPTDLMAYLCRLVTPPGGTVLDPFMGSGSTGKAAMREGFRFIGIDMTPEYVEIARARIAHELARLEAAEAEAQAAADLAARQLDMFAQP